MSTPRCSLPPEAVVAATPPEPAQVAGGPGHTARASVFPGHGSRGRARPFRAGSDGCRGAARRSPRGSSGQPATPPGAVPAPQVDAAALLQTHRRAQRANSLFRFTYRVRGDQGIEFVSFDRWQDAGSDDDAPTWNFANAGQTRVQTSSETFGQAVLASQVTPEMFGVLMYSRAHAWRSGDLQHRHCGERSQAVDLSRAERRPRAEHLEPGVRRRPVRDCCVDPEA